MSAKSHKELVEAVIRLSGDLPAGASEDQLKAFEAKLASPFPPLLRQFLSQANGGESILASHDGNFVPDTLDHMNHETLWEHLLKPIGDLTGGQFQASAFIKKYLPLGHDYSGEAIVIDLKSAPKFRVLISMGDGVDPKEYEELSPSLEAFFAHSIEEFSNPPPPPVVAEMEVKPAGPQDEPAIAFVQQLLSEHKIEGIRWGETPQTRHLWFRVTDAKSKSFMFQVKVTPIPLQKFGSFILHTSNPTLVTLDGAGLVAGAYKNLLLINDVTATIPRGKIQESPMGFEKCRATKTGPKLQIFESYFKKLTAPRISGLQSVAVMFIQDDVLFWLGFNFEGLADESHANEAINLLLSHGPAWFTFPGSSPS